jgi:hypothetical protein
MLVGWCCKLAPCSWKLLPAVSALMENVYPMPKAAADFQITQRALVQKYEHVNSQKSGLHQREGSGEGGEGGEEGKGGA